MGDRIVRPVPLAQLFRGLWGCPRRVSACRTSPGRVSCPLVDLRLARCRPRSHWVSKADLAALAVSPPSPPPGMANQKEADRPCPVSDPQLLLPSAQRVAGDGEPCSRPPYCAMSESAWAAGAVEEARTATSVILCRVGDRVWTSSPVIGPRRG